MVPSACRRNPPTRAPAPSSTAAMAICLAAAPMPVARPSGWAGWRRLAAPTRMPAPRSSSR
ncbi:hypothetical protein UM91_08695 [Pseudomonas oryzihabitans]|nr:hypothetical protein UM91_08695 [Pseudomonas oryzihabitans]